MVVEKQNQLKINVYFNQWYVIEVMLLIQKIWAKLGFKNMGKETTLHNTPILCWTTFLIQAVQFYQMATKLFLGTPMCLKPWRNASYSKILGETGIKEHKKGDQYIARFS